MPSEHTCPCRYYFRVLERQNGSVKFGSYAAVVTGLSYALQLLLGSLVQVQGPLAPAPLALVFASFIPFLLDIPATRDFTVLGYTLTDKVRGIGGVAHACCCDSSGWGGVGGRAHKVYACDMQLMLPCCAAGCRCLCTWQACSCC